MEPLSLDTYRMTFWYAVCQGAGHMSISDTSLLKQMQTALSSMKITFVLCGSKEDAEKKRWELSASSQLLGETRVSKWLAKQGVDVPQNSVRSMVLVHDRIMAAQLGDLMEELEVTAGAEHPLATVSTLEKIMSLTKIDKNVELSNKLVEWIFYDALNCLRSGWLDRDAKRDDMIAFSKASLLGRRCVFYLIQKLKYGQTDMAADPRTPAGFLANMLSHRTFLKGGFHDGGDQTWLADLYSFQRDALYSIKLFFSGSADLHNLLLEASQKDANVSAEVFLQCPKIKILVDIDHLLDVKLHPGKMGDLEPKTVAEAASALPDVPVQETQTKPETEKKPEKPLEAFEDHPVIALEDESPETEEERNLKKKESLFAKLFPDLCPPQYIKDIFMKVERGTLENMANYAKHRVFSFVDVRVWQPSFDWEKASSEWGEGPLLFVADSKCYGPGGMSLAFQKMLYDGLVGNPKSEEATTAYCLKKHSVAVLLDGTNQVVSGQINRECQKRLKANSEFCRKQGVITYRLLYHGREFAIEHEHPLSRRSIRGGVHAKLPDPLETLFVLKGKTTTIPTRERLYLDLPGDSRSLGFSSLLRGYIMARTLTLNLKT
ncbi:unnamed protein product [Symbiodinium microadriaticum]|nr:unnamed protein product [Symbiodinium microadriaticum]